MTRSSKTDSVMRRLGTAVSEWLGRGNSTVTVDDLNPGSGRGLGIEPLEERIAPGTLVVNPPGQGGGTTVDLPDAANNGLDRAADRSPAVEPPGPPPGVRVGPV